MLVGCDLCESVVVDCQWCQLVWLQPHAQARPEVELYWYAGIGMPVTCDLIFVEERYWLHGLACTGVLGRPALIIPNSIPQSARLNSAHTTCAFVPKGHAHSAKTPVDPVQLCQKEYRHQIRAVSYWVAFKVQGHHNTPRPQLLSSTHHRATQGSCMTHSSSSLSHCDNFFFILESLRSQFTMAQHPSSKA
jgi:hypothetical protein